MSNTWTFTTSHTQGYTVTPQRAFSPEVWGNISGYSKTLGTMLVYIPWICETWSNRCSCPFMYVFLCSMFFLLFFVFFHKKQITKMNLNFFFWAHKILELPNDLKSENTVIFFFRYCFVSFNLTIMNQCHISGVVVAVCLCVLLQTASASLYYTGYSPALYGWNQPSTDFFGNSSGGNLVMPIFRKFFVSFSQINSMIVSFLFLETLMPFLCNCHGVRSVTFPNCFY